jgi:hypothetical protein
MARGLAFNFYATIIVVSFDTLQAGLQKMVEAKEDVNKMKAELAIKNQELAAASKEAEALLKSISESTAVAEKGGVAAGCYGASVVAY